MLVFCGLTLNNMRTLYPSTGVCIRLFCSKWAVVAWRINLMKTCPTYEFRWANEGVDHWGGNHHILPTLYKRMYTLLCQYRILKYIGKGWNHELPHMKSPRHDSTHSLMFYSNKGMISGEDIEYIIVARNALMNMRKFEEVILLNYLNWDQGIGLQSLTEEMRHPNSINAVWSKHERTFSDHLLKYPDQAQAQETELHICAGGGPSTLIHSFYSIMHWHIIREAYVSAHSCGEGIGGCVIGAGWQHIDTIFCQ